MPSLEGSCDACYARGAIAPEKIIYSALELIEPLKVSRSGLSEAERCRKEGYKPPDYVRIHFAHPWKSEVTR